MTDSEAAEILALAPGTYTPREVAAAADTAQIKTQNACRHAATVAAHEDLLQKLVSVKQARAQLLASAQGGMVRIPPPPTTAWSRRRRKSQPASRWTTRPAALARSWRRAANAVRMTLGYVCRAAAALWSFIIFPFRLLAQRKLLRGAATLVLTIAILLLSYVFITAGVEGVGNRVMSASEWVNRLLAGVITQDQDTPLPKVVPNTSVQAPSFSIEVWVDDKKMPRNRGSKSTASVSGVHNIEIRREGEPLYASNLFFPPGGKVTIDGDVASGSPHIVIQIDLPAIRKSDDASHATSLSAQSVRTVGTHTASGMLLHPVGPYLDATPSAGVVQQKTVTAAIWPALQAHADMSAGHAPQDAHRRRVVIDPVMGFLLLPLYLCLMLMDCAIIFILIRLLTYFTQARPIVFLDDIGARGVDILTDMVASTTLRRRSHTWTRRQEEAFTLFVLALSRLFLGAVVGSFF